MPDRQAFAIHLLKAFDFSNTFVAFANVEKSNLISGIKILEFVDLSFEAAHVLQLCHLILPAMQLFLFSFALF